MKYFYIMAIVYRTPEYRFRNLKDFPFSPHYTEVNNLQMHYLDEGPCNAKPVLLLHGVPAWSYLYRHMVDKIAESGNRVVVPDLIGFGKSDKPRDIEFHTYRLHVEWLTNFIHKLKLEEIILFCHDWGSLIGLRIAARHPELFTGIIVSNGMLPAGDHKINIAFRIWKIFTRYSFFIPVDRVIESGTVRKLDKEERKAYCAPFPSMRFKAAIRALPDLVPLSPDDPESIENRIAWKSLTEWKKPLLTLFSIHDPITKGGDEYIQKRIPGAASQEHKKFDAGHFIQEDRSAELSDIIINFRKKAEDGLSN